MRSRKKCKVLELAYLLVSALFLLSLFFISCAPPKIKSLLLVQANSPEAATLRRIAVFPFTGQSGYQISADVEALLVSIRVGGKPYFKVIERSSIQTILNEHYLQKSGIVNEKTAVKAGTLAGAEGIILGTVMQSAIEDKRFFETRTKCSAKDKDGKCVKRTNYKVRCKERNAYFSFTPKMINVATGRIVASESLSGRSSDTVCRDSDRPFKGTVEMLTAAKQQAIEKFRELIAPHYLTIEIALLEKDDTKPPPTAKENIVLGIKWAKQGRLDRACELWHEAYRIHPQGYAIHYLLGVCSETAGRLHEALNYYEKADSVAVSPVKEINEALCRVRPNLEKKDKLEEQVQKSKTD